MDGIAILWKEGGKSAVPIVRSVGAPTPAIFIVYAFEEKFVQYDADFVPSSTACTSRGGHRDGLLTPIFHCIS